MPNNRFHLPHFIHASLASFSRLNLMPNPSYLGAVAATSTHKTGQSHTMGEKIMGVYGTHAIISPFAWRTADEDLLV